MAGVCVASLLGNESESWAKCLDVSFTVGVVLLALGEYGRMAGVQILK